MPDKKKTTFAESIIGVRGGAGDAAIEAHESDKPPSPLARRGTGQDLMLELRFKDGRITALAYSYLARADYCPEKGITLKFSTCEVLIEGINLRPLYNQVVTHHCSFIPEEPRSVLLSRATETPTPQHVSKITVREPEEEDQ